MQPAATVADGAGGVKLLKGEVDEGVGPVNGERWWRRREGDVPVDQVSWLFEDCVWRYEVEGMLMVGIDVLP